jgi:signal peptidase I
MTPEELSHKLRKEAISKGHSVKTVASGYSMYPFLRAGDILTVDPVPMNQIKRGDIVVFEMEEKWIAHRVVKIRNSAKGLEFLLRGDTCMAFDPIVDTENYLGIIRDFTRKNSKKNITDAGLLFWKKIIVTFGIVYNFPLYCTRIFAGLILSPFLKR